MVLAQISLLLTVYNLFAATSLAVVIRMRLSPFPTLLSGVYESVP